MDFVAIDFETANEERGSACEISLVRFSNGQVSEKLTSFIFQDRFSFINTSIHGITEKDVAKAPEFEEFWPTAREFIGSAPLVAHNAGFDMGVLYRSLRGAQVGAEIPYFCTMVLGRRAGLDTAYFSLGSVAANLGVSHPEEHRAESDAITAGNVAVSMLKHAGHEDLWELAEAFNVRPGLLSDEGPSGCVHKGGGKTLTASDRAKILESIDPSELYEDPDFVGKNVLFTGKLEHLVRDEAHLAVMRAGGVIKTSMSPKINMVVTGYQDPRVLKEGADKSNKLEKATELRKQGHDIEIIDERMFMEMLENPQGIERGSH